MTSIKIISDSTCDLPNDLIKKFDISVVPLKISMDSILYTAGIDISSEEFYQKIPLLKDTPITYPPSTIDFFQAYEKALENAPYILSIHISKLMSETVNSAENARKMLPYNDIRVFDSKTTGASLALIVINAINAINIGKNIDEVCEIIEKSIKNVRVIGFPSTLKYLIKGGRLGKAKGLIGTLLGRVPILSTNEGETSSITTIKGTNKAIAWILNFLEKEGLNKNSIVALTHGNIPELAYEFKDLLINRFHCNVEFIGLVGPVVGSHLGPGSIFFSYMKED